MANAIRAFALPNMPTLPISTGMATLPVPTGSAHKRNASFSDTIAGCGKHNDEAAQKAILDSARIIFIPISNSTDGDTDAWNRINSCNATCVRVLREGPKHDAGRAVGGTVVTVSGTASHVAVYEFTELMNLRHSYHEATKDDHSRIRIADLQRRFGRGTSIEVDPISKELDQKYETHEAEMKNKLRQVVICHLADMGSNSKLFIFLQKATLLSDSYKELFNEKQYLGFKAVIINPRTGDIIDPENWRSPSPSPRGDHSPGTGSASVLGTSSSSTSSTSSSSSGSVRFANYSSTPSSPTSRGRKLSTGTGTGTDS